MKKTIRGGRLLAALLVAAGLGVGVAACAQPSQPNDAAAPVGQAPGAGQAGDEVGGDEEEGGDEAKGDAENGQKQFTTCAGCHGPDANGLPNLGKDLHNNAFLTAMTDDQAVAFLKVGRPADDPLNTTGVAMPPKGGNPAFSDDDLRDIVAYLRTLK